MWLPIQPASIDQILLCLVVYLSRATGDSQLERTCLLVWGLFEWHKAHMGSEVLFHLARFAPVANCCWMAFLAKLNRFAGTVSRTEDQREILFLGTVRSEEQTSEL